MFKFSKKLNKAEEKFFKYLFRQIKLNNFNLKLYENEILNLINPYNKDKVISNFILKFMNKHLEFIFKDINNDSINIYLNIISNLKIQNKIYYIELDKGIATFLNSLSDTFYCDNKEVIFLNITNNLHKNFIELLLYQNILNDNFTINLDSLKEKLGLKNMYKRFYDFEKYILIPFIEDVNKNTKIKVTYSVIHTTKKSNSKIIGLRFIIKNRQKNINPK